MLWRFQGKQYHDLVMSSHVAASVFNAQRTKRSDRWFTFLDFHPDHAQPEKGLSGNQVSSRITARMTAAGGTVEWLADVQPQD